MLPRTTMLVATLLSVALEHSYGAPAPVKQQWVMAYGGDSSDSASAVAADRVGNVYVTGGALESTYDYVTIKYDANGREVWIARYDGGRAFDLATAIAVDNEGFIYVTGGSQKLSPDGTMTL